MDLSHTSSAAPLLGTLSITGYVTIIITFLWLQQVTNRMEIIFNLQIRFNNSQVIHLDIIVTFVPDFLETDTEWLIMSVQIVDILYVL